MAVDTLSDMARILCSGTVLLLLALLVDVNSTKPVKISINTYENRVNISCKSTSRIYASDACQFKLSDEMKNLTEWPFIDAREGSSSDQLMLEERVNFTTEYDSSEGFCSLVVDLNAADSKGYLVFCRMHFQTSGWEYDYSSMEITKFDNRNISSIETRISDDYSEVHQMGMFFGLVCIYDEPYDTNTDSFTFPNRRPMKEGENDDYKYDKLIKKKKHYLRLNIFTSNSTMNGVFWCNADLLTVNGLTARGRKPILSIISQRPSSNATLDVTPSTTVQSEQQVNATCHVGPAVPAARVTWMLGDRMLGPGHNALETAMAWKMPWEEQSVTQRITIVMKTEYNGLELKCVVKHPGYEEEVVIAKTIHVTSGFRDRNVPPGYFDHLDGGGVSSPHFDMAEPGCHSAVYWLNVALVMGLVTAAFLHLVYFLYRKNKRVRKKRLVAKFNMMNSSGTLSEFRFAANRTDETNTVTSDSRRNSPEEINEYAEVGKYTPQIPNIPEVCYSEPNDRRKLPSITSESTEYSEPLHLPEGFKITDNVGYAEPFAYREGDVKVDILKEFEEVLRRNDADEGPAQEVTYAEVKKMRNF